MELHASFHSCIYDGRLILFGTLSTLFHTVTLYIIDNKHNKIMEYYDSVIERS